ncbi:LLM class flavin-dependent oxidoreductase [Nocardiopsis flavescens]|uniref:LLM class flavin-dependent oxidoreductase n=1 Tax=Nocardiopsis flavescens TaxID=758803 RepID=UPI003653C505
MTRTPETAAPGTAPRTAAHAPGPAGSGAPRPPVLLLNTQYLPASRDWRTPEGRADSPFAVDTFLRAAQRAEEAGFDAFFHADFSGVDRANLRSGPPVNAFEPFQLAALVAAATSRIAVMPTVSTLHTHPFAFARGLASLDRIARGRAWVNVVSSFRSGTAIGMRREVPRERRHLQTEEFLAVARKLWASWPPEALEPDPAGDRYIRDDLVTDVDHRGEFYEQSGPIDMAPYSARFPFTLQATSSLEGLRLAARTADAVFAGTPTQGAARELRRVLREEAVRAGRAPDSVALLPGAFLRVAAGPEEAGRLAFAERQARARGAGGSSAVEVLRARFPGLRLEGSAPGDRITAGLLPEDPDLVLAAHGSRYLPLWDLVWGTAGGGARTVGGLAERALALNEHAHFSGTPEQIAARLRRWHEEGAVDGFQFILGNGFEAVCAEIAPALRHGTTTGGARPPRTTPSR